MSETRSNLEKKRARESRGGISPLYKQSKMADSEDCSENERFDKIMEVLAVLKKGGKRVCRRHLIAKLIN